MFKWGKYVLTWNVWTTPLQYRLEFQLRSSGHKGLNEQGEVGRFEGVGRQLVVNCLTEVGGLGGWGEVGGKGGVW